MAQKLFAEGSALHFTLREMKHELRTPALWIGLFATGIILGLSGPFGTEDAMRTLPRMVYWLAVVVMTYCTGSFVATWASRLAELRGAPKWPSVMGAAAVSGVFITLELVVLNVAIFGAGSAAPRAVMTLAANVIVISIIVSSAYVAITDRMVPHAAPSTRAAPPAILERLPYEKRGPLVSLSVQDHYVDVVTEHGAEMVLLRLRDAIRETHPTPGIQIHRSHWIATDQVARVRRNGAKAVVTLKNGRDLPASRTYIPALKDAGLLPR